MSFNRATLIGRLGKDPETRALPNGGKVVNFSLATDEKWTDKTSGEKKSRVQWHNIVIFNERLAETAERFLKKGSQCMIEGQIETRKWEKDGIERYATEIVLRPFSGTLQLLGDAGGNRPPANEDAERTGSASYAQAKGRDADPTSGGHGLNDDIPF